MQLRSALTRALLGRGPDHDPFECRTCGTSLERERTECPACGSRSIAAIQV